MLLKWSWLKVVKRLVTGLLGKNKKAYKVNVNVNVNVQDAKTIYNRFK